MRVLEDWLVERWGGEERNVMCFSLEIKSMNVMTLLLEKHEVEVVPSQSNTPGPCSHLRCSSVQSPDTESL